jgi:hypothetical protein
VDYLVVVAEADNEGHEKYHGWYLVGADHSDDASEAVADFLFPADEDVFVPPRTVNAWPYVPGDGYRVKQMKAAGESGGKTIHVVTELEFLRA